jgi:hypothetical protein
MPKKMSKAARSKAAKKAWRARKRKQGKLRGRRGGGGVRTML